jgi:hypothetical protein
MIFEYMDCGQRHPPCVSVRSRSARPWAAGARALLRQLSTEGLLLGLVGAVLGTLFATAGIRAFRAANPIELPVGAVVNVFDQRGLMTTSLRMPARGYGDAASRTAFYDTLLNEVGRMPGVGAAALATGFLAGVAET